MTYKSPFDHDDYKKLTKSKKKETTTQNGEEIDVEYLRNIDLRESDPKSPYKPKLRWIQYFYCNNYRGYIIKAKKNKLSIFSKKFKNIEDYPGYIVEAISKIYK